MSSRNKEYQRAKLLKTARAAPGQRCGIVPGSRVWLLGNYSAKRKRTLAYQRRELTQGGKVKQAGI